MGSWWNSTDDMLEPGTRAALDAYRAKAHLVGAVLCWPCGCEQTRVKPDPRLRDRLMLHLCDYHMGFDDGLSAGVLQDVPSNG